MNDLVIWGARINQDPDGFLSLTDMWKLSGQVEWKAPRHWRRLPTTGELVQALCVEVGFSHFIEKTPEESVIYTRKGRNAQTFAHIILALAYAEYLDPKLGIEVRRIALRFWGGDVSLLDDFMRNMEVRAHEDENRVITREKIRDNNSVLQFRILYGLGARGRRQYADFHNAGYEAQYNGENEDAIKKRKGLGPKQDILDYMNFQEAAANMFRTALAQGSLTNNPVNSVPEACAVNREMGRRVRAVLIETGQVLPEDQPNVDSIASARKRLRNYAKAKRLK